jgi:hypothetical protein
VISAMLDEGRLDGVVEELHDRQGRVQEVSLLLRPHAVMMAAIKRMAAALAADPVPDAHPGRSELRSAESGEQLRREVG